MIRRILLATALVALTACSGSDSVLEDGGPRPPDDVGIATDVTLDQIQIDGKKTYEIRSDVESFATRSHHITQLLSWEKKYVHIGLDDDDRVRWIAGIGIVSRNRVSYSGVVQSFDSDERTATFEDGTVLTFARGVDTPQEGVEIVVEIDVKTDQVVRRPS